MTDATHDLARRIYLFSRDARRQNEAWCEGDQGYVTGNPDLARLNALNADLGLKSDDVVISAVAEILADAAGKGARS